MRNFRQAFVIGALVYTLALRLMPYVLQRFAGLDISSEAVYPWNFSPLTATCLLGGAVLASRKQSLTYPLVMLLVSDLAIGLVSGHWEFAFHSTMPIVYACVVFQTVLGMWVGKRTTVARIAGVAVISEVVFFMLTNLGAFFTYNMYPHTLGGLAACYIAALPFLRLSLFSTAVYSIALFGGLAYAERGVSVGEPVAETVPSGR